MALTDASQPTAGRARVAGSSGRRWAIVAAAAALAVFAASGVLLTQVQHALGYAKSPPALRAWLTYPQSDELGVAPGTPLFFNVTPAASGVVHWRTVDGTSVLGHGTVRGPAGQSIEVDTGTATAPPRSWILVEVQGLPLPLKVWVT